MRNFIGNKSLISNSFQLDQEIYNCRFYNNSLLKRGTGIDKINSPMINLENIIYNLFRCYY